MNDATFNHKGHTIYLAANGNFVVQLDGKEVSKPSLAAIKKYLDRPVTFTPFDALVPADNEAGFVAVRVVGKNKPGRRRWSDASFELSDGHARRFVYADTAENRAVLRALHAKQEELRAIEAKFRRESEELNDRLPRIDPK